MTKRILAVIMMLTVMLAFISCGKSDDDIPEGLQKSENIESVPWYIIASFSEFKAVNDALKTMDAASFEKHMEDNYSHFVMNGMYDYEASVKLMEELKSTTVLIHKNNIDESSQISFYYERNEIHTFSLLPNGNRISCYSYSPLCATKDERDLSLNENLKLEMEVSKSGCTVKLFSSLYEDRGVHGEAEIDGSYFMFWSNKKQSVEEFAKDFSDLDFVKIGDILDGTYGGDVSAETRTDA